MKWGVLIAVQCFRIELQKQVMLQLLGILVIIVAVFLSNNKCSIVKSEALPFCGAPWKTSTCPGDKVKIPYPFWIENRTFWIENSGSRVDDKERDCMNYYPLFQIKCAANGRPVINISSNLYHVLDIYPWQGSGDGFIRVVDVDIDAQECPQPRRNISIPSEVQFLLEDINYTIKIIVFYNCSRYPENVVQNIPCLNQNNSNNSSTSRRSFAFFEQEIQSNQYDWYGNCEEAVAVYVSFDYGSRNYTQTLKEGFSLRYKFPISCGNCELSGGKCWTNETNLPVTTSFHCNCTDTNGDTYQDSICPGRYYNSYYYGFDEGFFVYYNTIIKILVGVSMGIVGILLSLLVLCRRKCYPLFNSTISRCRKKIKGPTNVEMFLDNNNQGISSQSFKYSDIKKMTNSFKDTLGQGGYGSVFKGKLRDGRLVAVKLLTESKGKGEDFINEVATIGRTNHVNVVSLLGFCAEGTKRALVYEFMPNGSLEKFIHNTKDSSITSSLLGWEKLYQIALGIARGLDYLHRGCNTRILHFDIKPHNILLDQDFCPKISDFGLAKLCPTKASLVSMVGARGTPGYIAPELYCGNFGGVSHKSDVYSYGMMVLEIIGGRKNMDISAENASQIYFPQWIYKRLIGNIEVEESGEIEAIVTDGGVLKEETARKMIIVALWCIQAHPGDRPSMTKVVDMLEGNTEDLEFPPNPFPGPSTSLP